MSKPIFIGTRRELFVDDALVDTAQTTATRALHHPESREVVIEHDAPWEGDGCDYHCILKDEGFYRLYYPAWSAACIDPRPNCPADEKYKGIAGDGSNKKLWCFTAKDGIHFKKARLMSEGGMFDTLHAGEKKLISGEIFGDSIDREIDFEGGKLDSFAGRPITLEIDMRDADIYSFKFDDA